MKQLDLKLWIAVGQTVGLRQQIKDKGASHGMIMGRKSFITTHYNLDL
jgi:hypothetical protein